MESLGRLDESDVKSLNEIVTGVDAGPGGRETSRKGIVKVRILHVVPATVQIAILRGVKHCRLALQQRLQSRAATDRGGESVETKARHGTVGSSRHHRVRTWAGE